MSKVSTQNVTRLIVAKFVAPIKFLAIHAHLSITFKRLSARLLTVVMIGPKNRTCVPINGSS